MGKFINLVRNEQMKLFKQKGSWVMAGLLIVITLLAATLVKLSEKERSNHKNNTQTVQQSEKSGESTVNSTEKSSGIDEKDTAKSKEQVQSNENSESKNVWWFFNTVGSGTAQIIILFLIIIAASSVAKEFSQGTIKLLLIRPSKRWKILSAKYVATILCGIYFLVIWFVVSYLVGGIFFGFADFNQTIEVLKNGVASQQNAAIYILEMLLLSTVPSLILWTTFAFMISSVFRTSALAIGLSIFLYFAGGMVTGLLIGFKLNWIAKFMPFINTEWSQYVYGKPIISGMTLIFSVCIVVAYIAIFKIVAFASFLKRDVL